MASILFQITHGPEDPTKVTLGLLVAKAALDEGHSVTVFLGGDAVQVIRDAVLDNLHGLGTGSAREHFDGIVAGGGRFCLSRMSSNGRGVTDADLEGKPAEMIFPKDLVRLILEHDRAVAF